MSIRPDTVWTIVASALMAHADGVMDGEECDRLMAMIDAQLDGEAYAEWLGTIGDRDVLLRLMQELPPPPADQHRQILEEAWTMAVVDGERSEAEAEMLQQLAVRFGVEPVQLEFWRDAWTESGRELAEVAAESAAHVLGGDGPPQQGDRAALRDLIAGLPTAAEHRETLLAGIATAAPDALAARLSRLSTRPRRWVLRAVAGVATKSVDADIATARFETLAAATGQEPERTAAMLDAARYT